MGFNGYLERLTTQVAGGSEPDVMQINWAWLAMFSKRGKGFTDLAPYKALLSLDQFSAEDVAMGEVARADDQHTLILGHIGTLAVNPYIFPNQPFDVNKDFLPVTLLAKVPNLFVIHPDVPANNFKEFVAYAKKNQLDLDRWHLLNGSAEQVRVLANVLGFQYRPNGNGQYSHTIRITVLDREGVVVDHYDGLDRPLEPIAARISALLAGGWINA